MKQINRYFVQLFCGILLFTSSCAKDDNTIRINDNEGDNVQLLTNVFKGTELIIPDDYDINTNVRPYYNEETGELTVLCNLYHDNEQTENISYQDTILLTFENNIICKETILELGQDTYVDVGVLTGEALYFIKSEHNYTTSMDVYSVGMYSFSDASLIMSEDISTLFTEDPNNGGWFSVNEMVVDDDEYVYINSDTEIVVLDRSLKKSFSIITPNPINNMATSKEGVVYIEQYLENGVTLYPIDRATQECGKPLTLLEGQRIEEYYFGNGYDIYYTKEDGLYGYNYKNDNANISGEILLFNFINSDIYFDNVDISLVIDQDHILVYEQDAVTYRRYPMLYQRSGDIDLLKTKILEIAFVTSDNVLKRNVVDYNKNNNEVRIIVKDYSVYNTSLVPDGGYKKLINDILNGIYKPDIITGSSTNDEVVRKIYEKGLYLNLYSYIDESTKVSKDDILGCVTRTFESETGDLWAIGTSFTVQTLIGSKTILNNCNSWNLNEMVNFAYSLPDGVQLLYNLNQEDAMYNLMGNNGYGIFIDMENGSCNFENKGFISYLEFLSTLPKTAEESPSTYNVSRKERYLLYHNGKIALMKKLYSNINDWIADEVVFYPDDVTRIGYPTNADGRGKAITIAPYIITSFCKEPTEAWRFIESIIVSDKVESAIEGFPIFKSDLKKICDEYHTYLFEIELDGSGMSWKNYDSEVDNLLTDTDGTIIKTLFTEKDEQELVDWLDNEVGQAVTEYVDSEIYDIINEEITSYLSGIKSADECAKIIQSRISVWIAEHT